MKIAIYTIVFSLNRTFDSSISEEHQFVDLKLTVILFWLICRLYFY